MAELRFYYGPMSAGKSTLALQVDHTWRAAGRRGLLLTAMDRSGAGHVTSRLGVQRDALEVTPGLDLEAVVCAEVGAGGYVVADEAQFYAPEQVDALARCVDGSGVDVSCFGLLTDFAGRQFPGSARLVELADELLPLPLPVVCWCGRPARLNGRLVDGVVTHEGAQVVLGDTADPSSSTLDGPEGTVFGPEVHYRVLCRRHWAARQGGPAWS